MSRDNLTPDTIGRKIYINILEILLSFLTMQKIAHTIVQIKLLHRSCDISTYICNCKSNNRSHRITGKGNHLKSIRILESYDLT